MMRDSRDIPTPKTIESRSRSSHDPKFYITVDHYTQTPYLHIDVLVGDSITGRMMLHREEAHDLLYAVQRAVAYLDDVAEKEKKGEP